MLLRRTSKIRTVWIAYLDALDRGGQVNLIRLVTHLDPARHDALVLVPGRGPLYEFLTRRGHRCAVADLSVGVDEDLWRQPRLARQFLRLFGQVLRFRPHVVVVDAVAHIRPSRRLASWSRSKLLWHAQTASHRLVDAPDIALSDLAIAVAPHVEQRLHDLIPGLPIECIPNAVDTEVFSPGEELELRQALGAEPDQPVVLHVGGLYRSKGVGDLIAAFAQLQASRPNAWLWLVGTGEEERELACLADSLGVSPRVRFLGRRPDVFRYYRAADVYVLASHSEGLPLALLEAMASGAACVGADIPGIRELCAEGAGRLAPVEDPAGLAHVIAKLLDSPAQRRSLGEAARRRAQGRYRLESFVGAFDRTLVRLARGSPASA